LTGLAYHADRIYVAVQSTAAARILILDRSLSPVGVISNPAFSDIHSIHVEGNSLIVCSTGARAVLQVSLADYSVATLCDFEDGIHLNSACFSDTALLVCCHHLSKVFPDVIGGGVIDPGQRHVLIAGLGQPHSLVMEGPGCLILDSDAHRIVRFDRSGIKQHAFLSGFLRGAASWDRSLFVGRSAGRVISRKTPAIKPDRGFWDMDAKQVCIYELDAETLEMRTEHFPLIAGFEIYDLLALDGARAVDPPQDRLIIPDLNAMARAYYEAAKRVYAELHLRDMAATPASG
jgi:hypothetical protein